MRHASRLQLLAALLWSGFGTAPLVGQATVAGVVIDAGTRRPLAGVLIVLDTTRQITSADGKFRFTTVIPGSLTLRVSHIAYAQRQDTLAVQHGDHIQLQIPIAVEAIRLTPLNVEVRSRRLMDVGFYERAARGHGIYIIRKQLDDTRTTRLGDYLARVPGVRRAMVNGEMSRIDMRGGKSISLPCDTQFFVDGTAIAPMAGTAVLENLTPHDIEGIEIYRGASETPIQFDVGRTSCGAIVIWTRHS
ncbi:MAG: TonB-dependent receptor [Gemmatimonadetes bacterium]|nr:TonB-dependent receptor [Gemmatimonadota bacterium]